MLVLEETIPTVGVTTGSLIMAELGDEELTDTLVVLELGVRVCECVDADRDDIASESDPLR